MSSPDDALLRLLRDSHIFSFLVRSQLEEGYLRESVGASVTFTQLNILKMIATSGRHHVGDVAHFLDASYAAASKLVDRMKARKLIRGTPFAGDRRAEVLELTPAGRGVIEKYEKHKLSKLRQKLRGVGAPEMEKLSGALERLLGLLLEGRDLVQRACLQCGAYYSTGCLVRETGADCPYWSDRVSKRIAARASR
jgi:DNA-binding MarR family transcriptional regulator